MKKIVKLIREEGLKAFFKKWKEGINRIPPESLLKSEINGYIGSIIGTIAAIFILIFMYDSLWAISIILAFNIIIQGSQVIGKYQILNQMRKYKDLEEINEEDLEDEYSS